MGSELVNSAPHLTYTEQFNNHFPFYLSIGMTYDQYWNEDCELPKYYRQAHELKTTRKNQELWLQGMYIYEALCDVSPVLHAFAKKGTKPQPYTERPYAKKANRKKARAVFETWAAHLKLPSKREEVSADGND
jgi:hypothetical protein